MPINKLFVNVEKYYALSKWYFFENLENFTFWFEKFIGREDLKINLWELGEHVAPPLVKYMYYHKLAPYKIPAWRAELLDALNWIVQRKPTRTPITTRLLVEWLDEGIANQQMLIRRRKKYAEDLDYNKAKPVESTDYKYFRKLLTEVAKLVILHKYKTNTLITMKEIEEICK